MNDAAGSTEPADDAALAPTARLLGRLLVRELDATTQAELQAPALVAAMAAVGITAPRGELGALAAEYFELVLQPTGSLPPVQSLWQQQQYDGDAAIAVRRLADAAGLVIGPGARAAPPDHLGCLLCLWADLAESLPAFARHLASHHFDWVASSSAPRAPAERFYGQVLRAAARLAGLLATR